jgi:hypothetical protein
MTREEKIKCFRIQGAQKVYVAESSMSTLSRSPMSGKWDLKLSVPFEGNRKFYCFTTLALAKDFLKRHNLLKEEEPLRDLNKVKGEQSRKENKNA